jgi:hypothetical protein
VLLALLVSLSLRADVVMPGAAEQERFKTFFSRGEELYKQGEYGAAIWNFREADKVRVTPEVAFDLAKCHEKLNDVAFATFYYRQYLKRAPNATDALDVAERVGTVLAKAEAEGRGLLEVLSPGAIDVAINKASFAEAPVALFLAPGEYEVTARFPSGIKKMVAQIRTGKTTPVAFEPMPPPLLDAEGAGPLTLTSGPSKPVNKLRILSIPAFVLGIAGVGIGIPFMAMSSSEASRCCSMNADPSLSASDRTQLAGDANTHAFIGNGGLGAGIGFVVVGAVLLILSFVTQAGS